MKYFCPDKKWEYNSRVSNRGGDKWFNYVEGYKIVCELIEKEILETDRSNQDFLLFPYCNCLRHYIEISLKEIIDNGSKLFCKSIDPTQSQHDISSLLNQLQEVLNTLNRGKMNIPQNVQDFIMELDTIDGRSTNFRYPIDRNGNATLENISMINFKKVAEGFKEVRDFLEGISAQIAD
jgi:hypothetical protein